MVRQWLSVKVVSRRLEATDIYSYELADAQNASLPPFSAGAHIDVEVRHNLVRQYSLCNHPEERHRYLIAVLKDPSSRGGSIAMHERIEEGDIINISEPRNHFPLTASAKKSLLFAGGIGVTPILCMAERLAHVGSDFEMHYCARSFDRMAFVDRIRQSGFADQVQLHVDDGADAQKLDVRAVLATPQPDVHIYVCGPGGFMDWVLSAAKQLGWPDAQVHREYFAAAPQTASVAGEFEIQVSSSGQSFVVPANKSITTVLKENGIDIPVSCEQGVCGTCLTHVLEGEPEHLDSFLTDEERARNDQIMPCCSRSRSRKLVLDL